MKKFCLLLIIVICCVGWASEAVICAYGLKDPGITDEQALQIRQVTSAVCYGILILPIIRGWGFTMEILPSIPVLIISLAACAGTASYLLYYRAITRIGPAKAMALNITYSAWAMMFAFLLMQEIPKGKSIICAVMILMGSITAAKKNAR